MSPNRRQIFRASLCPQKQGKMKRSLAGQCADTFPRPISSFWRANFDTRKLSGILLISPWPILAGFFPKRYGKILHRVAGHPGISPSCPFMHSVQNFRKTLTGILFPKRYSKKAQPPIQVLPWQFSISDLLNCFNPRHSTQNALTVSFGVRRFSFILTPYYDKSGIIF